MTINNEAGGHVMDTLLLVGGAMCLGLILSMRTPGGLRFSFKKSPKNQICGIGSGHNDHDYSSQNRSSSGQLGNWAAIQGITIVHP